jgi:hypothetical protein
MRKVVIIDTSILCIFLDVPKMETAGAKSDHWDKERVTIKINEEIANGSTLVLPLATIIETGNHIAQAIHNVYDLAESLADLMIKSADSQSPWAAFSVQESLWSTENIKKLAYEWPSNVVQKHSIGDATIVHVAQMYVDMGMLVEILTGDQGLKSFEPIPPLNIPRRRMNK